MSDIVTRVRLDTSQWRAGVSELQQSVGSMGSLLGGINAPLGAVVRTVSDVVRSLTNVSEVARVAGTDVVTSFRGVYGPTTAAAGAAVQMGGSYRALIPVFGAATAALGGVTVAMVAGVRAAQENAEAVKRLMAVSGLGADAADNLADTFSLLTGSSESLTTALFKMGIAVDSGSSHFAKLGISVRDSVGRMKPEGQLLLEVRDRISEMGSASERSAALMQMFGRAGRQLAFAFSMSREEFAKWAERAGGISDWSQRAQDDVEAYGRAVRELGMRMENFSKQLGLAIIPVLNQFLERINKAIELSANPITFVFRLVTVETEEDRTRREAAEAAARQRIHLPPDAQMAYRHGGARGLRRWQEQNQERRDTYRSAAGMYPEEEEGGVTRGGAAPSLGPEPPNAFERQRATLQAAGALADLQRKQALESIRRQTAVGTGALSEVASLEAERAALDDVRKATERVHAVTLEQVKAQHGEASNEYLEALQKRAAALGEIGQKHAELTMKIRLQQQAQDAFWSKQATAFNQLADYEDLVFGDAGQAKVVEFRQKQAGLLDDMDAFMAKQRGMMNQVSDYEELVFGPDAAARVRELSEQLEKSTGRRAIRDLELTRREMLEGKDAVLELREAWSMFGKTLEELTPAEREQLGQLVALRREITELEKTQAMFKDLANTVSDAIEKSVTGVIMGTQKIGDAFRNLGQSIILEFTQKVIRYALSPLTDALAQMATGVFTGAWGGGGGWLPQVGGVIMNAAGGGTGLVAQPGADGSVTYVPAALGTAGRAGMSSTFLNLAGMTSMGLTAAGVGGPMTGFGSALYNAGKLASMSGFSVGSGAQGFGLYENLNAPGVMNMGGLGAGLGVAGGLMSAFAGKNRQLAAAGQLLSVASTGVSLAAAVGGMGAAAGAGAAGVMGAVSAAMPYVAAAIVAIMSIKNSFDTAANWDSLTPAQQAGTKYGAMLSPGGGLLLPFTASGMIPDRYVSFVDPIGGYIGGLIGSLFGGKPRLTHEQREAMETNRVLGYAQGAYGDLMGAGSVGQLYKRLVSYGSGYTGGTSPVALMPYLENPDEYVQATDPNAYWRKNDLGYALLGRENATYPTLSEEQFRAAVKSGDIERLKFNIQAGVTRSRFTGANVSLAQGVVEVAKALQAIEQPFKDEMEKLSRRIMPYLIGDEVELFRDTLAEVREAFDAEGAQAATDLLEKFEDDNRTLIDRIGQQVQSIEQALASALEAGFQAPTVDAAVEAFGTNLRGQLVSVVAKALVDAVVQSEAFQNVLTPAIIPLRELTARVAAATPEEMTAEFFAQQRASLQGILGGVQDRFAPLAPMLRDLYGFSEDLGSFALGGTGAAPAWQVPHRPQFQVGGWVGSAGGEVHEGEFVVRAPAAARAAALLEGLNEGGVAVGAPTYLTVNVTVTGADAKSAREIAREIAPAIRDELARLEDRRYRVGGKQRG